MIPRPCNRCLGCRRGKVSVWVSRLLFEGWSHDHVSLITLTYAPRFLPEGGTLVPSDVASWAMRLRTNFLRSFERDHGSAVSPRLRFFPVGEYGSQSGRPHYHVVCYGADLSTFVGGRAFSELVSSAWGMGSTHVGSIWCAKAAEYVSGYVVKGHNVKGLGLLGGRHPEFARPPRRPGLGVPSLQRLAADVLRGRDARELVAAEGDLPSSIRLDGRDRVIGGFLMDKLRSYLGFTPEEIAEIKRDRAWELSAERGEALLSALLDEESAGSFNSLLTPVRLYERDSERAVAAVAAWSARVSSGVREPLFDEVP